MDEIVGTLIAVAPTVGTARVVSAAPELALALGYDVEAAFEGAEADDELSSPSGARARHRVGRRRLRRLAELRRIRRLPRWPFDGGRHSALTDPGDVHLEREPR